jgi:hypothetical protein
MLAASFLMADVLPEYMKVYPIPQEVTLGDYGTYTKPTVVAVRNVEAFDVDALRVLKGFVTVADEAAFVLNWKWDDTLRSEGYTLKLTETGVDIAAKDASGLFYAVQTLRQLLQSEKFMTVTIKDWPSIRFRGSVEGFYGQPWSFEARKSQFRFYGDWKMNTYIYGPKDDPYHGFSTQWRDPYPAVEANRIAELVKVAKENWEIMDNLMKSQKRESIERIFADTLREYILELVSRNASNVPIHYDDTVVAIQFYAHGIAGVLMEQCGKSDCDPKRLSRQLMGLMQGKIFEAK